MANVLLVDDDELVRYALANALRKAGHEVIDTEDALRVPDLIRQDPPDFLITDIIMPEQDGIGLIYAVRKINLGLPILAISGGGRMVDTSYLATAKDLGANATLEKPFELEVFLALVNKLTDPTAIRA